MTNQPPGKTHGGPKEMDTLCVPVCDRDSDRANSEQMGDRKRKSQRVRKGAPLGQNANR